LCASLSYIFWRRLSRRKLSPTLATAHYSCPDNAIGLVAQCEHSGNVQLGFGGGWAGIFTRIWQPCHSWCGKMAVRWRHCGLYYISWLRRPKLTPVSLISLALVGADCRSLSFGVVAVHVVSLYRQYIAVDDSRAVFQFAKRARL